MNDAGSLARRLLSLAIEFTNASRPLSLDHIHRAFYADHPRSSFYTLFRRDRESLEACGLSLREAGDGGWEIDPSSLAGDIDADPADLLALDLTCLQLAADPSFPYRQELRHALLKVDRSFSGSPVAAASLSEEQTAKTLALLEARSSAHPVRVRYSDAAGATTERTLAIWGEFGFRGHVYFVACDLGPDGELSPGDVQPPSGGEYSSNDVAPAPRVFRDDRFRRVRVLDGPHCPAPDGFRAEDWQRLPFQIGKADVNTALTLPRNPSDTLRTAVASHGTVEVGADGTSVWHVQAADLDLLAAWAVAEGLVPQEPEHLVRAWRETLGEACHE